MHNSFGNPGSLRLRCAIAAILAIASTNFMPGIAASAEDAKTAEDSKEGDVTKLSDMEVTEDPLRALSNEPTATSFGFSKPLLETPRSVTFVSEEQIRLFGISTVEDLTRVVPGTFTTTRYGLQGAVNVRGVPADYYFRGMKRLDQQGHARTVLSAMDNIEVVKGPPSPIFGMGKIGGYVNLDPKSSRARTGKYLPDSAGFVQGIIGSYDRTELSFGVGGPMSVMNRTGGYYVYGLVEESKSYIDQVGVKQRFLQATNSIDNAIGPFRLEMGGQAQQSITSGAYMNRLTQDLIDSGTYITGMPLANLNTNGDSAIGFKERYLNSPVVGGITANNTSLQQRLSWPTDASGKYIPLGQWPTIAGVPQTMLTYLNSHPEVSCPNADVVRGQSPAALGAPGSQYTRQLPVGFALDPCSTGFTQVDYRRNGSFEQEQNAKQMVLYLDLIYDVNPDFTVKNQIFYDLLDSFKNSYLPYGEKQNIHTFENKATVTRRVPDAWLPSWLRINSLGSANYRRTAGNIRSSGGDFDTRQDVMYKDGHLTGNTSFYTQLNNFDLLTGAIPTARQGSWYDEKGVGLLFDVDIFRDTNLVAGARYDWSHAKAFTHPDFLETTGTDVSPGLICDPTNGYTLCSWADAEGSDEGKSMSASLSHQLPWLGLRPYFTLATASIALDNSNNILNAAVIAGPQGHIGSSKLKEAGIKSSMFHNKLQMTVAAYEQSRNDVSSPSDPSVGVEVSSSIFRGIETEVKWAPTRDLYMSAYALFQHGIYSVPPAAFTVVDITGTLAGFQDIKDASGKVIYPANAYFYGGRLQVNVPAAIMSQYMDRTGTPETQLGYTATYQINRNFGVLVNGNFFSRTWADRLKTVKLPEAWVWNAGATWDIKKLHFKINGYNVFDRRYFRARNSDTSLGVASAMPTARWEFTFKSDF